VRARPHRRARAELGASATGDHTGEQARLPKGALRQAVLDHLRGHPDTDVSPAELANVLRRNNSRAAISNSCRHWVAVGQAVQTRSQPSGYRAAPPAPEAPASE
jgi:hypothetical protein